MAALNTQGLQYVTGRCDLCGETADAKTRDLNALDCRCVARTPRWRCRDGARPRADLGGPVTAYPSHSRIRCPLKHMFVPRQRVLTLTLASPRSLAFPRKAPECPPRGPVCAISDRFSFIRRKSREESRESRVKSPNPPQPDPDPPFPTPAAFKGARRACITRTAWKSISRPRNSKSE